MERLVGLRPRRRRWIRIYLDGSGGGPKDVKKAERELQLSFFCGRVSGRMEGFPARLWSAMLMSLKQTGEYVKAIFRSSPWTFLVWRKRTGSSISWRGSNLRQNVQDLGAAQAASLLDWKYLARGSRDQAKVVLEVHAR